jgi:hypothetical protein
VRGRKGKRGEEKETKKQRRECACVEERGREKKKRKGIG